MGGEGLLIVVSGPSGTGKGTLCRALMAGNPQISYSISATTRQPRQGEVDGIHYNFLTKSKFEEMLKNGDFLEWAQVYDNYYGTPKQPVKDSLKQGKDILLEIDIQGALKVKEEFPEGVYVFIVPPSLEVLKERIIKRATDSEEVIKKRLNSAGQELTYANKYDYIIINDTIEEAVKKLEAIIIAEKSRSHRSNYKVSN